MYSTQHNFFYETPQGTNNKVVSTQLKIPDNTGERKAEGGLRTQGIFKQSKKETPLLSIITVVYNNVSMIERCLLSVLEQDYDNVEYIVIDGSSTDGTLDVIKKYEDAIDYYVSEPDSSVYGAMNKGLALASGDAINFMNSDDYFLPHVFSLYVDALKNETCKLVYAQAHMHDCNEEFAFVESNTVDRYLFSSILHQAVFTKTEVFEHIGYFKNETYQIACDHVFLLEAYLQYGDKSFLYISQPTVTYFLGGISFKERDKVNKEKVHMDMELWGNRLGFNEEFFCLMRDISITPKDMLKVSKMLQNRLERISDCNKEDQLLLQKVSQHFLLILPEKIESIYDYTTYIEQNRWFIFGKFNPLKKIIWCIQFVCKKYGEHLINLLKKKQ